MSTKQEIMERRRQMLVATTVSTGVYLSRERRVAIVIRVKGGHVAYITMASGTIELAQSFSEKFLRDHPVSLHLYPAMLAVRKYAVFIHEGMKATEEARVALRAILLGAASK